MLPPITLNAISRHEFLMRTRPSLKEFTAGKQQLSVITRLKIPFKRQLFTALKFCLQYA